MRIALVSDHADPVAALTSRPRCPAPMDRYEVSGQHVHVQSLAAGLAALGHAVTVFTRRSSVGGPIRRLMPTGYVVEYVAAGPPAPVAPSQLLPHVDSFGDHLRMRWQREPVDVVHTHGWTSGLAGLRATQRQGPPVVHTFGPLATVEQRHLGVGDHRPSARLGYEERLARETAHVIATSTDELRELWSLGLPSGHATVIPGGVDTHAFQADPLAARAPGPHRLVVVGALREATGIATTLQALIELPDTVLHIVGGPVSGDPTQHPEAPPLRRLALRLGIADRVHFLGGVPHGDVPAILRHADLLVATPWYAPRALSAMEAMACGLPVVGTGVGALLDTVVPGRTGELVPALAPEMLARAIRSLLDDPWLRVAYGEAGRRRVQDHFTWAEVAHRTAEVYRTTVASVPGQALTAAH